jgi:hypothetical protein
MESAMQVELQQHPDDLTIDLFAAALKVKLARARAANPGRVEESTVEDLSSLLRVHTSKGDPLAVASFCMQLWSRGSCILKSVPSVALNMNYADLTYAIDVQQELHAERRELERRSANDRRQDGREGGRRRSDHED